MSDSPVAIIYGSDGYGGGYKEKGTINTPFCIDGYGTAGIPRGGVVTVQGVAGGIAMPISGSVTATNASVGADSAAKPSSDTLIGGSDGTNLQAARVFDVDSGIGTQYVLGTVLRKSASGGSVELGTASDPVRTDPTGSTTQPVSGTVTANIGTSGSLALDATLTGGTQKAIVRGGAKGTTTAADVTATAEGADHQALDVQLYHGGVAINPLGVIPNATDTTGTIIALNGTVSAAIQGYSSCAVVFTGTWSAILVFEMSIDGGTTWASGGFVTSPPTVSPFPVLAMFVTTNGSYQTIGIGPTTNIRIRAAGYTSGTVGVRLVFADTLPAIGSAFTSMMQNVMASIYNNSTANLAVGASFTGIAEGTQGVSGIRINIISDQPMLVQFQQSQNGTNWDHLSEYNSLATIGCNRTYQVTALYFRMVVTNIGNATTTYFRLQTALCPVVEVLPPTLTPNRKLSLASMSDSWAPDPSNHQIWGGNRALLMDTDRNLNVRARVLTDEASFRDDFTSATIYTDKTGTYYFTNGSTVVTGVGTAFVTELNKQHYIKQSTHADSAYVLVSEVKSDTYLELAEPYIGATASGTGRASFWQYIIGSGASITQTGSEILIASGTTSGTRVNAIRGGDYLPYVIGFKGRVTQRIANQVIAVGLGDSDYDTAMNQTFLIFDGTTNTTVKLRTSSATTDVETTTVTLPDGLVSSTAAYYQLEITNSKVTLFCNDVRLAEHKLHIPGPYSPMDCHACIHNTGVAGSTTTLALDTYFLTNFDRVEISNTSKGDAISVKELRASVPTVTSVAAAVADTSLLAANPNRLGATVVNDSIAICYLKFGSGASNTSYTVRMTAYAYYEVPFGYTGRINAYWASATGNARITEVL